ncbi:hypothetical protein PIB30_046330, partial [Stylosanthes scabra]|nr:hypothetical protein [Stylosanthes scabra]
STLSTDYSSNKQQSFTEFITKYNIVFQGYKITMLLKTQAFGFFQLLSLLRHSQLTGTRILI